MSNWEQELMMALPWPKLRLPREHKGTNQLYHFGLADGVVVPITCDDSTCWCGGHEAAEKAKLSAPRPRKLSY